MIARRSSGKLRLQPARIIISFFTAVSLVLYNSATSYAVSSLFDSSTNLYRVQNNIPFTGGGDVCVDSGSSGGTVTLSGDLPEQTLKHLKAAGIEQKLTKTKERYLYAEKETKVSWQIMAALHYREAGMAPDKSIADGSSLSAGVSKDGLKIDSDPNTDAKLQAQHFIDNAKSVYGIDVTKDSLTAEELAQAFLAYNRGSMYKNWNKSYLESPYVMNGYDNEHLNMKWIDADSYDSPGGRKLNNISGLKDGNPIGALTMYKYLTSGDAGSDDAVSSSAPASGCSSSSAVASDTCSVTAPVYGVGSGGNGHQLTQQELTSTFGDPGSGSGSEIESQLVTVDFIGNSVKVHKLAAGCLQAVANEWKTNNITYTIKEMGCYRFDSDNGSTNIGKKSYHTYGVACDINWSTNGFYYERSKNPSHYDMPQNVIDAFKNHGWSWGGDWNSVKDYMHFEFNGLGPGTAS